jgi:hypothetical protein
MYRLRLPFPIRGGEEAAGAAETMTVPKAEFEKIKSELAKSQAAAQKLEAMVLDPAYIEWVTSGGGKGAEKAKGEDGPDFAQMDNKALVEHILGRVEQLVSGRVQAVQQDAVVQQSVQLVNQTAARVPDFWDYREMLEKAATVYPTLHPGHAYIIAKVAAQPELQKLVHEWRPAAPPPAEPGSRRAPTPSEQPTNRPSPERRPERMTTAEAVRLAWQKHVGKRESL